ncbi:CoA-binding protein [Undibacterium danionis]|uniref:CoA-binding protein n=1 Tax=Undibacterium danionis TaxID=1812100 RepID=A0ABV6IGE8_9BURK
MSEILIDHLLNTAKTIAIVGISNKPERDSYKVAQYLQEHGYKVLAVNPLQTGNTILSEICYASLSEARQHSGLSIDIVDCFRKSEDIPEIVQEAIAIKAGAVWMQLDIVNEAAAEQAQAAGLQVVMDKCTKIEHKRLHQIS